MPLLATALLLAAGPVRGSRPSALDSTHERQEDSRTMSEDEGMQGAGTRPTAFLSYSHADQDRVRVLANALEQAGISV